MPESGRRDDARQVEASSTSGSDQQQVTASPEENPSRPSTTVSSAPSIVETPLSGAGIGLGWAAAAFANVVTFTPLAAAWLYFTGWKYVEELAARSALPIQYLELSDRFVTMSGFEIVLRSLNWWVLLLILGVIGGVLLAFTLYPLSLLCAWIYRRLGGQRRLNPNTVKKVGAIGTLVWASLVLFLVCFASYAAVFITPSRATCVATKRFELLAGKARTCKECASFGVKARKGIPLLAGKDHTILLDAKGASFVKNSELSPVALPQSRAPEYSIGEAVDVCSQDANGAT